MTDPLLETTEAERFAAANLPIIRTLGEYLSVPIPIPPVVVGPDLFVRGGLHSLIGHAGKGKSVLSLQRILRWAADQPLFPEVPDLMKPAGGAVRSLVIENEGAAGTFQKRLKCMITDPTIEPYRDQVDENVLIWGDGGYSGLRLDEADKVTLVRNGLEHWRPDVVFVEPFRGLWSGDENSSTEMNRVVNELVQLAVDYECAVLISHHPRKSGVGDDGELMSVARGSGVLGDLSTLMEHFQQVGDYRELRYSKNRTGQLPDYVRMHWRGNETWTYEHVSANALELEVVELLKDSDGQIALEDIIAATGEETGKGNASTALKETLARLVAEKKVKKDNTLDGAQYRWRQYESGGQF